MKVCLVNSFYPPYIGGAETYVSSIARNLAARGHDVTVYCASRPSDTGRKFDGAVKVMRMRTPLVFYGTPVSCFPASILSYDYDILHCNFPNPYFAAVSAAVAKTKGLPAVLTWHNDLPRVTSGASVLVALNDLISDSYLEIYSRIIATTVAYARASETLRRHARKVIVIPNGVDSTKFNPRVDPEKVKQRYRLDGFKTLIFVGALTTWHVYKGLEELLTAFALVEKKCAQLKLLIVGGGNLLPYYRQLAGETNAGDRIVFAGQVDDDDLPSYYAAADFAVLPSRNSSEGFGLVLLEAMACGKAVIGSRVGGIPEVVDNLRNGILAEPMNPRSLADAIEILYADDELRERMGNLGREFAQTHDWKVIAERTEVLYRNAR